MNPDPERIAKALAARQPDMTKVEAAVRKLCRKTVPDYRTYPPRPSPVAQDAAIRKPLKAHGVKCRGFNDPNFLNRDS